MHLLCLRITMEAETGDESICTTSASLLGIRIVHLETCTLSFEMYLLSLSSHLLGPFGYYVFKIIIIMKQMQELDGPNKPIPYSPSFPVQLGFAQESIL